MAVTLPDWGKADWTDYVDYWRESDAEYLQSRSILRYHNATDRTADVPAPSFGQVTYNEAIDSIEMYSKTRSAWARSLLFQNLASTKDDSTAVSVSHTGAASKGISFKPAEVTIELPLNVLSGVLKADNTGVTVQTPSQAAVKLSTDSDELLVDTKMVAPAIRLTGTGTVVDAGTGTVVLGTLNATTVTATSVTASGTLTGATVASVNGGTLGGVTLASNTATAPSGHITQTGIFTGDSSGAIMRQRASGGALGNAYVLTSINDVFVTANGAAASPAPTPTGSQTMTVGSNVQMRVMGGKGVEYWGPANTLLARFSPVTYAASDPGAANFPDGTIWFIP
jgi:hypothetical protein